MPTRTYTDTYTNISIHQYMHAYTHILDRLMFVGTRFRDVEDISMEYALRV